MRDSGESPEKGKPEAWGLFLDTPISPRNPKSLSLSTYKVKVSEDPPLSKALFLLSYSEDLWFGTSNQGPLLSA